ncbi:hypothetical protein MED217_09510 [Leeuwenhoekiella blandensis MED217]|uniref:Uncharacterized protein n=1 Tax=Leeuwenhoekiella blandensis (strain CECT 7118 / CCUG 51940 / KCTC 22103 / MED217) TaxID=398720 RepID=A3XNU4_LEEBM|nr:hypothetical protein MED217_09510 [Leeuwenhoekiella blandensis MED217]
MRNKKVNYKNLKNKNKKAIDEMAFFISGAVVFFNLVLNLM